MARFNLDYTFTSNGSCADCPFWYSDELDTFCYITNTFVYDQKGFNEHDGRLKNCPLREVDE